MDLMDDELRRVLSGSVDAPADSMARELDRLRVRDRGPTVTERAAASQPSFRMPSSGRRRPEQRGGGEALEALGSTILGSVPAGLAGAAVLPFQGPEGAAKTIGRVQDYLTIDPQTEGGDKALLGILKALSPLGAPAQAVGDTALRLTGSPLAATAAEVLLDPLNAAGVLAAAKPAARAAAAGARQVGKAAKATGQSLGPKAAEMAEAYLQRAGMAPQIFVGKSAKTWDAASNARAAEMEAAGIPAQTIWRETGNWRAPDGQWRQEISDQGYTVPRIAQPITDADTKRYRDSVARRAQIEARSNQEGVSFEEWKRLDREDNDLRNFQIEYQQRMMGEASAKLGELAPHRELLAAYPNLGNISVRDKPMKSSMGEAATGIQQTLYLNPINIKRDLTAIHELQHFVQDIENFSPGGAEGSYLKDAPERLRQIQKERERVGRPALKRGYYTDEEKAKLNELMDREAALSPFGQYQRLMGEAESRAAEARMNLTPEERRAKFPEESYDVPIGELIDAPRTGGPALLTTYHGTPHIFPAEPGLPLGRFRAEKIGSGEGAQVYGHGAYVAESPKVGKRYQETLSLNRGLFDLVDKKTGAPIPENTPGFSEVFDSLKSYGSDLRSSDISAFKDRWINHKKNYNERLKEIRGLREEWAGTPMLEYVNQMYSDTLARIKELDAAASLVDKVKRQPGGSFYTVDLPDPMVDRMLDWDRPISEQSELVQSIAKKLDTNPSLRGAALYNQAQLKADLGEGPLAPAASEWFRGQGIPGIKYLDEGSRGAEQGTRNFVVFPGEEDKLTILQRNDEKLPTKKADGGLIGETMSYTTAADTIADKLMRQGMDPDQAFMTALRMSDARMKAGGAVLMAGGGDAERELTLQARNRNLAALDRALAPRARKTWDGPMIDRPIVNGKALVSAEELADFRRRFGEKMTLRDLLNADKGRGPSGAMPAARGAQGANVAPRGPLIRPDEAATLPPVGLSDIPGLVMRGMAEGAERVPAGRGAGAAFMGAALPRALSAGTTAAKTLRDHPSISPERRQMLKEMEDYISGLNQADRPAVDPKMRALEERLEPPMQVGGPVKKLTARAAARAEARLAEKAAKQAAERVVEAKAPTPLVLPPAAPMTKEQMRPIAQRMAAQTTGEFVRPDPRFSVNPAGKSRKVFERERELPVGVSFKAPESPAPVVDLEKHLGSVLVGIPGDPTIGSAARAGALSQTPTATAELKRLGDVDFEQGVQLFGGPRYGAGMPDDRFWASGLGAARAVQNRITDLSKMHDAPVLGQYIKMSPESTNYALHNLDALLAYQQPEKLNKAQRELLEGEIRKGSPKYGQFPNFAGFDDPMDVLLQAQIDPNLRKHIAETLMKPTVTEKLGLRQGSDVLFGITEPSLRDVEVGTSGFSIGKMQPGVDLRQYPSAHPTYDVDIPGEFIGQSKYPIPAEIAFPSSTAYARSKLKPGVQEFNMLKFMGPREKIDRQYVDQMKMFEELMKEYTGKKKGGAARKAKAGALDKAAG